MQFEQIAAQVSERGSRAGQNERVLQPGPVHPAQQSSRRHLGCCPGQMQAPKTRPQQQLLVESSTYPEGHDPEKNAPGVQESVVYTGQVVAVGCVIRRRGWGHAYLEPGAPGLRKARERGLISTSPARAEERREGCLGVARLVMGDARVPRRPLSDDRHLQGDRIRRSDLRAVNNTRSCVGIEPSRLKDPDETTEMRGGDQAGQRCRNQQIA